jgi:hypothetical protein
VILDGLNVYFANRILMVVAVSFATILYFYIVSLLVKNLLSARVVTANLIYCAISIYLLIGIMWAGIYNIVEGISPGSFSGTSETVDLIYFSFVTLTTVGFGDVVPLLRIPVNVATRTTGRLPPEPGQCCHPSERSDAGVLFYSLLAIAVN